MIKLYWEYYQQDEMIMSVQRKGNPRTIAIIITENRILHNEILKIIYDPLNFYVFS